MWYTGKVLKGDRTGREIGYPTINLDPSILPTDFKQGIYASKVKYKNQDYTAALYFGPRLIKKETHPVLEIFILNFREEIYDETINFKVGKYIREVRDFSSPEEMGQQIDRDIEEIKLSYS